MNNCTVTIDAPPRVITWTDCTPTEARRITRYLSLLDAQRRGRLSFAEFHRRVKRWAPIRGERLLADPEASVRVIDEHLRRTCHHRWVRSGSDDYTDHYSCTRCGEFTWTAT
jgi:hypothetical protein